MIQLCLELRAYCLANCHIGEHPTEDLSRYLQIPDEELNAVEEETGSEMQRDCPEICVSLKCCDSFVGRIRQCQPVPEARGREMGMVPPARLQGGVGNIFITALCFMGPAFLIWSFLNTVAIFYGSTAAFPFPTILLMFAMWACVTFPLTVLGGIIGRHRSIKQAQAEGSPFPCKTNKLAREIPACRWYQSPITQMFASGFLPFSAIYIELHYIFNSVWGPRIYFLYGILLLAFTMLLLVAGTVTVLFTYFHLNAEDHRWWWRAFCSGVAVSVFFYLYCIYFFLQTGMTGFLQCSFFFLYSLLAAHGIALTLGCVSFYCTYFFVIYIYSRIKAAATRALISQQICVLHGACREDPRTCPHQASTSSTTVVMAVERLTHNVLRCVVDALKSAQLSQAKAAPAAVLLFEPCHSLIQEHGAFAAATDRRRRLSFTAPHWRRLARLWAALDAVHRLNKAERTCTQRELFYRAISDCRELFGSQSVMDRALRDAVGALQVGRPHLGILTAEKGLLAGDIAFKDPSAFASLAAQGSSGTSISESMLKDDNNIQIGEKAKVVLVVEKDTIFQHLLHSRLLAALPMILVTGRGYPDLLTRRFLQKLHRIAPHLLQLYLGDFDPDGVAIYLLYRTSCEQLRWLGLHSDDVKKLPVEAGVSLSKRDHTLQASLLRREEVRRNPLLTDEIRSMTRKFELEALHAAYADEGMALKFIPDKIKASSWI
ncbi:Transmembrane 9 superfamily member 4 (Endomembrane protein 10) (Transmembrane nine protein 4) (AtTMN4) [Durusdinium trenchii]|uniref:Transmembrane 9 superfamily member n=1 Tax=Durusdinium trenchii TaxID=1381693 RepID=A0ABP0MSZ0_9DINO